MKPGWEIKTLGTVLATIRNGVNCQQTKSDDGDRISRIESISDGTFNVNKTGRATLSEKEKTQFKLEKGDVLFSHINSPLHVGKTAVFDSNEIVYHGVNLLLFRPERFVSGPFLEHYLKYLHKTGYWRARCKQSVNQASVNQTDIKVVPLPLPPLEEQQRIVAILDEAFEGLDRARANAEANLQSARELFLSALDGAFTKDVAASSKANLADVVTDDCTLSYGIVQPGDEVEGGLPIVRPTDLGDRIIVKAGLKSINPKNADGYKRTELKGGDILLCVRGSTGVVSIADKELRGANVTRGIVPIRFNERVLNQYYGYFQIVSSLIQKQIKAGTYGAALMQINIRDLRKIEFIVPTMDRQSECVEIFEELESKTDTLILEYAQKLQDLDDLRQSLLQKAFAGELT